MVVQHNLTAMNSNRMLGLTTASQAKSTEKLSSGYKINRAADDAAGLSISEKMRKQIRGLTQASSNAQDGISTVQTAEGALTEVHDMLQRMNELAVKASNGTNSEDDREYIQNEIDQLTTEIDRVSTTTKFNETYLLQGDAIGKVGNADVTKNAVGGVTGLSLTAAAGADLKAGTVELGTVGAKVNTTMTNATANITTAGLSGTLLTKLNESTDGTVTISADASGDVNTPQTFKIGGTGAYTAADLAKMGLNITPTNNNAATEVKIEKSWTQTDAAKLQTGLSLSEANAINADALKGVAVGTTIKATVKTTDGVASLEAYDNTYMPDALKLELQVGADSSADNKISVEIKAMSSAGLGLLNADGRLLVNGKDSTNADKAIDTIANAIQAVSTQRSALGAVQNRLEHTINNLDNVVENTTSAESAIRDTDMATEMVKYSNNNILSQAGQAMLAQANQSNQGVLSLLQ